MSSKQTAETRCATAATLTRADELRLGDQVVMTTWHNDWEVVLVRVRSLELVGDDVVMTFFGSLVGETTTSVGHTFHVVSPR